MNIAIPKVTSALCHLFMGILCRLTLKPCTNLCIFMCQAEITELEKNRHMNNSFGFDLTECSLFLQCFATSAVHNMKTANKCTFRISATFFNKDYTTKGVLEGAVFL